MEVNQHKIKNLLESLPVIPMHKDNNDVVKIGDNFIGLKIESEETLFGKKFIQLEDKKNNRLNHFTKLNKMEQPRELGSQMK